MKSTTTTVTDLREALREACDIAIGKAAPPAALVRLAELRKLCDVPVGDVSDGYHTFNELYEHRIALFIALCAEIDARMPTGYVWRSKRHSDGSKIDGWFLMGISREHGGQITYHLPMNRWEDTNFLGTESQRAPEFDGHTSNDVLERLARYWRNG